ncbi:hypothetical protein E4U39_006179, partial [Claviceps sp. Clav50 group G5]
DYGRAFAPALGAQRFSGHSAPRTLTQKRSVTNRWRSIPPFQSRKLSIPRSDYRSTSRASTDIWHSLALTDISKSLALPDIPPPLALTDISHSRAQRHIMHSACPRNYLTKEDQAK